MFVGNRVIVGGCVVDGFGVFVGPIVVPFALLEGIGEWSKMLSPCDGFVDGPEEGGEDTPLFFSTGNVGADDIGTSVGGNSPV